jgi:CheY-like chemotaxis protein
MNILMSSWIRGWFNSPTIEKEEEDKDIEKQSTSTISGSVELSNDEADFLIELIDNGYKEFIFQPEDKEQKDSALQTVSRLFDNDSVYTLINSLTEKKYLIKKELEPSLHCPNCYSPDLKVIFSCSKCSSKHITKSEIYEHPYCGYRDVKSAFFVGGNLVCPKCGTILVHKDNYTNEDIKSKKDVYINSYRVNGSLFECNSCKNKMNKPNIEFHCNNCGIQYNYINAIYQTPIRYIVPEKIYKKILVRNKVELLIVEDFPPEAEVLSMLLSNSDLKNEYEITIANTGSEALFNFEKYEYNLVILDLGLPDIDGLELLKKIKSINPDVKVIVYTGYDDREIAIKAMKTGASEFLIKNNDDIDTLLNIIDKLMSERKTPRMEL